MVRSVLRATVIAVLLVGAAAPARAAQGILVVQVSDLKGAPIPRVQLATKGDGSIGPPTDAAGRTRISLAAQTRPQTIVALTIVSAPKDLVFISPWDNQVRIPPFENESQNFASVVLADRTDRALLENGKVVVSVVSKLNLLTAPKDASNQPAERRADALSQTAAALGVQPSQLDTAIRAYGPRATDPYDKGMVALYAGDMANATERLTAALKQREERLEAGKRDAADAAFFLAQALYRQNQYAQAVAMYRKALAYRPGDPATTNNLALALLHTGDYAGAAPLLQLAVATIEAASGPNDPEVVFALNNVGAVLFAKGEVVAAENAFRRGLAIRQAALGAGDVRTANSMTNVASVLLAKNEDAAAESLLVAAHDVFARAYPAPTRWRRRPGSRSRRPSSAPERSARPASCRYGSIRRSWPGIAAASTRRNRRRWTCCATRRRRTGRVIPAPLWRCRCWRRSNSPPRTPPRPPTISDARLTTGNRWSAPTIRRSSSRSSDSETRPFCWVMPQKRRTPTAAQRRSVSEPSATLISWRRRSRRNWPPSQSNGHALPAGANDQWT